MTTRHEPIDRVRFGRIEAAIWRNNGEKGPWHAVTLSRSFKDKEGKFQSSDSLSGPDLLIAAEALRQAYLRCRELDAAS